MQIIFAFEVKYRGILMTGRYTSEKSFLKWLLSFIAFALFSAIPIYAQARTFVVDIEATASENQPGFPGGLNRYESMQTEDPSQVDDIDEGDYWEQYNVFDSFYEDWADFSKGQWSNGSELMETVDEDLHNGYGITLTVCGNEAHDPTIWTYECDDVENYTGLWIADLQDTLRDMTLLSVDPVEDLWHFDRQNRYGYGDLFISGIQEIDGKDHYAVPEPGTFFLLGAGLIGVIAFRRKIFKL
jgi:hypothetical protein